MFADLGHSILPTIFKIKSFEDLHQTILRALDMKIDPVDLDKYVTVLEENTFDFDWLDFVLRCHKRFYYDGNLVDVEIDHSEMEKFLNDEKNTLERLADEHLKKLSD
jgi:hypothetical protein